MITGLDHVQLAMPRGKEELARSFYAGLLGINELPKPPVLAVRGGCWFASGSAVLHLGVEEPFGGDGGQDEVIEDGGPVTFAEGLDDSSVHSLFWVYAAPVMSVRPE